MIVISDHNITIVGPDQMLTDDPTLDFNKRLDVAMLLLNLRTHVDRIGGHLSDAQIRRQKCELEMAGYKYRIAELEEAERKRVKAAMCHICQETPNSHFLSCGHAFCQECIFQWVLKRGTCPTCREPHIYPLKAYNSVIIIDS